MRCVRRAGREVAEERAVGGDGLLHLDPGDRVIGEVALELVTVLRPGWWFDRGGIADQRRVELIGLAGDEAVEIIEALVGRPVVERAGRAGLVVGHIVVLAPPPAGVAGLLEQFTHGGAALGDDAAVTGVPGSHFLDHPGRHRMMVASGQQSGAGGGAQ